MVRFGILGFGLHAAKRLAGGFDGARHARLVALSRRDATRAQESAQRYGVAHAFTSAEDLCRCDEVDAILVATPNVCHCTDTVLALRHGKPVLCEKPMAMSSAECQRMIEAAHVAGLLLGVAQVFRFSRTVNRLRERVADIGRPIYARAEYCFPGRTHPRSWMRDRSIAGGGVLADIGVHCIDALRFVLQDEIVDVDAKAISDADSGDVEAAANVLLQFSRGTLGVVMVSSRTTYRSALEIVGEDGALRAEPALSVQEPVRLELLRNGAVVDVEHILNLDAFSRMLDAFALAVKGEQPFPCPGEEGLKNQIVIESAYARF